MDNSRMGVMGVGGVLSGKETEKIVDFFRRQGVRVYFFVVVGSGGTPLDLFPSATQHIKSYIILSILTILADFSLFFWRTKC